MYPSSNMNETHLVRTSSSEPIRFVYWVKCIGIFSLNEGSVKHWYSESSGEAHGIPWAISYNYVPVAS